MSGIIVPAAITPKVQPKTIENIIKPGASKNVYICSGADEKVLIIPRNAAQQSKQYNVCFFIIISNKYLNYFITPTLICNRAFETACNPSHVV
jgi:hypothetical protein